MGSTWDSPKTWESGGGFSKPGLGERNIQWPSFSSSSPFGTANPTCAECGGRLRGAKPCTCPKPHDHWKPTGKRQSGDVRKPSQTMQIWHTAWLLEAYRVLRPGGVVKIFGGTRTFHRLAAAMAEVGFEEIRIEAYGYATGFPKSMDIGKALDKRRYDQDDVHRVTSWIRAMRDKAGITNADINRAFGLAVNGSGMAGHWTKTLHEVQASVPTLEQFPTLLEALGLTLEEVPEEIRNLLWNLNGRKGQPGEAWFQREVRGKYAATSPGCNMRTGMLGTEKDEIGNITAPATEAAKTWDGWGTALKPAWEPVLVARKPPCE